MIRVEGLVRATSLVRQQLQAGIRPEEAPQFRERVASVLRAMDTICLCEDNLTCTWRP